MVQTASGRYNQLQAARFPYLERAREASKLTLPYMFPPLGTSSGSRLPTPYQSLGARGVNNLASKLLLALFPANQPFFRLEVGDAEINKILQGNESQKSAFQSALSSIEKDCQTEIETTAIRVSAFEILKHLLVGGNCLGYMLPKGGLRVFHLKDYVVRRDPEGSTLEIITKEMISPDAVPDDMKATVTNGVIQGSKDKGDLTSPDPEDDKNPRPGSTEKNIELFTWVRRTSASWLVCQYIGNEPVPGSYGTYPLDKSPWMPLRWSRVDGEDYGRGFVEEYQGDLQSLEGLTQAIVEASAMAAKVLWLVKPNGTTKQKTLANSPNGAIREGAAEDVHCMQMDKGADLQVAKATVDDLKKDLGYAFMLNSAIQRDAERVTSAEIRYMAQELETSLGGLYSLLSQEFQLPLVTRLMFQMERQKKLPILPAGTIRPTIVTGLEALGRGNDLDRLNQFMTEIQPLGPQVIQMYLNVADYMTRVGTGTGLDITGLIKPQQQVDAEQAQQNQTMQQQQALQAVIPHAAKALADGSKEIAVHRATSQIPSAPVPTPGGNAGVAPGHGPGPVPG